MPGRPMEAFLDWAASHGYNGVRVFAGYLKFAEGEQTPEQARENLPRLLDATMMRGLYVEVTINTGTARGYDVDEHTRRVGEIMARYINSFGEMGNEPWNVGGGQRDDLTPNRLLQLRGLIPGDIICALGAAEDDESTDYSGSDFTTIHLDRSRDVWNQVRRIREMQNVADSTGKPVMSNEPIGAAEPGMPGQRLYDPAAFMALGALPRLFEVGAEYHFEDGLHCNLPVGPNQEACSDAFVLGWTSLDVYLKGQPSTYKNSGWSDSPVRSFDSNRATRCYCGVAGDVGACVTVGGNDAGIEWQNGWHPTGNVTELPGCRITEIAR